MKLIQSWKEMYRIGEMTSGHKILVGKPEGKRLLGRRRWEDNIKMYLKEIGCEGVGWVQLAQEMDRWWALVNTVMDPQVSYKARNC
jgi:hypothetical protein